MDGAPDLRDDHNRVEAPTPRARRQRLREWIPTLAVVLVVITAVATAVMVALPSVSELDHRPAAAATQQGAACQDCGVVESVVALVPRAQDNALAYQMRIRMDDGSLRTVEQRGALAAGSRVIVAGGSVRAVSGRPGPG